MGFSWRARGAMCALALTLSLPATTALAQEPDAGNRMAARELAMSGAEAFDKQDFVTALDRFQRAESLYKVPSIAVMVARCLARVGRVVEAVDKYEETSRMPLDGTAPEAFHRAVADAAAEVDAVRLRVARLELRVPVDAPSDLEVKVDERPLPKALLGVPMPVNPGVHRITARASNREPYNYDINLAEGERQALEIALLPRRPSRPSPPHGVAADSETGRNGSARGASTLSIALFAGGGVALAAGTVSGVMALNHRADLEDRCNPGCPASMSAELESFRFTRTLSYVGFGMGIAAVGAGTYFLLHEGSSGNRFGAALLPGGASVAGTF